MKAIFLLILSYLSLLGYSQSYFIEYQRTKLQTDDDADLKEMIDEEKYNNLQNFLNTPEYFQLESFNGTSIFYQKELEGETEQSLDLESPKGAINIVIKKSASEDLWFKDFNTQEMVSNLMIFDKLFLIEEEMVSPNWQLSEETKTIGNLEFKKATLMVGDKVITAYYTEEIPISDGPENYYGLPGLIVDLDDGENLFQMIELGITEDAMALAKPKTGKKISRKEFEKLKEEKQGTPMILGSF